MASPDNLAAARRAYPLAALLRCVGSLPLLLPLLLPFLLVLLLVLAGCSREDSSEQLVVPEVVRTNLYVAPGGSDANPGTEAEPFRTISRAAQVVTPGTTVYVAPGQYTGGFRTEVSGSAEARIIFQSSERRGARIVPPLDSRTTSAWDNRGSHVDIVGFEIDGTQYQSGNKWLNGIYNGGSHNNIRHNHVHHVGVDVPCESAGGAGILVDGSHKGTGSEVVANNVHDIGPADCGSHHGIYIGTEARVRSNLIYRIAGAGIQLWHDANRVEVTGNTISTSGAGIVVGSGDYHHGTGPNDYTVVANNIVYDNRQGILELGQTGENNSYRNNLVFQNAVADWRLPEGRKHVGTIAAEPAFVEYSRTGTPDFRLSPRSPAIGKGLPGDTPEQDYQGKLRSKATGYDIGAFQH
ncbi:right-handed parallel beta-helix repeat-containing protein [Telluria sp. B2]